MQIKRPYQNNKIFLTVGWKVQPLLPYHQHAPLVPWANITFEAACVRVYFLFDLVNRFLFQFNSVQFCFQFSPFIHLVGRDIVSKQLGDAQLPTRLICSSLTYCFSKVKVCFQLKFLMQLHGIGSLVHSTKYIYTVKEISQLGNEIIHKAYKRILFYISEGK